MDAFYVVIAEDLELMMQVFLRATSLLSKLYDQEKILAEIRLINGMQADQVLGSFSQNCYHVLHDGT